VAQEERLMRDFRQDQKDRALRSVFFGQPGPFLYSGKVLDDSVFWSQDKRFQEQRLRLSLSRSKLRALGDLWFSNLCWQNP
jgi:hypothetical protein